MLSPQGSRSPGVQEVQTRGSRAVSGTGVLYGVPMAPADWLRGSLKGSKSLYCKRRPTLTGSDSAHLGAGPEQTTYQNSRRSRFLSDSKTILKARAEDSGRKTDFFMPRSTCSEACFCLSSGAIGCRFAFRRFLLFRDITRTPDRNERRASCVSACGSGGGPCYNAIPCLFPLFGG